MLLKVTRFVALLLAALTLGMGFCHLMQLPARMGWDQYLWVGSTVQGGLYSLFGSIGAIIYVAAVIVLALLTYFVREHGRPGFRLALTALLLSALALVLWWVLVYPVNVELAKWVNGPVPSDWTSYRPLGVGPRDYLGAGACGLRRVDRLGACRHAAVASLNLDLNVGADDAHVMPCYSFVGRVAQHVAGANVELRAVPRTGHLVALDLAFGERPFLVTAQIVERKELAIDVEQDDLFALEHHEMGMARCDLTGARGFDEFAHELVLLEVKRRRFDAVPASRRHSYVDGALVDGERSLLHRLVECGMRVAGAGQILGRTTKLH
jgi:hypothetical protein